MGFLFFKKKKKNQEAINPEEQVEQQSDENVKPQNENNAPVEEEEEELSPKQKEKKDRLKSLESKISKILQSNNIEIVDENAGDEYETDEEKSISEKQKQQDYEALKGTFGKDANKKQELTLTLDDFDYTYIGKYVEDYDLIHMKNIKRIKLQNKYKKLIIKITAAALAVIMLTVGGVLAYKLTREKPVYLASVRLSQSSQSYFVDENFNYTGLYLIETYSDGRESWIKLTRNHFQSSEGNYSIEDNKFTKVSDDVRLYFKHPMGFYNIEMKIKVERKRENGLTCKYTNGLFDLKQGDVITDDYLIPILEHSNYNGQKLDFSNENLKIKVDGTELQRTSTNDGFRLTSDLSKTSEIVVSYKNGTYELKLVYGEYSVSTIKPTNPMPKIL